MIYVKLKGGLGNQLFQFGASLRAAKGNIAKIFFIKDETEKFFQYRLTELFNSSLLPSFVSNEELVIRINSGAKIFKLIDASSPFLDTPTLDSCEERVSYLLDGYFQSYKNAEFVRNKFHEQSNLNYNQIEKGATTCYHYRHGDYSRLDVQKELGLINISYYDRAFNLKNIDNTEITFFSDDNYIEKFYSNDDLNINFDFSSSDITCFRKMLAAEYLVIPNSSFSLMAAYLSKRLKVLIRPNIWSRKWKYDNLTSNEIINSRKIYNSFMPL
jgi:hypothetical protein